MSHPITIPIFGSNNGQQGSLQQQLGANDDNIDEDDNVDWTQAVSGGGDNDMDFDLLAEYLLEENSGPGGSGMNFDFK